MKDEKLEKDLNILREVAEDKPKNAVEKYQIRRAKEYLSSHTPADGSEPSLEYCIISDLLRQYGKLNMKLGRIIDD